MMSSVELGVFGHNADAIRLYERLGFGRDTSAIPERDDVDGQRWTSLTMRLSRAAWGRSR